MDLRDIMRKKVIFLIVPMKVLNMISVLKPIRMRIN